MAGLRGDDRRAVMAAAMERLPLPSHADRSVIFQMLLARAKLGTVGVAEGFAIPHVRDPIVLRVAEPQVTLFLLEHPIDFDGRGRRPVHALFLIVTPTIQGHLLILSRIGTALQDGTVRSAIKDRDSASSIIGAIGAELRRLLGRSLKLRQVSAGGCNGCELDTNVLNTVGWDLGRFGVQFVASPRHADGLLITGAVSQNMKLALQKTYDAIPAPKIVIAVGACAIGGGQFVGHAQPIQIWRSAACPA